MQDKVLQVAADVAAAMCFVHSRGIVHGDLSPANILLQSSSAARSGVVAKVGHTLAYCWPSQSSRIAMRCVHTRFEACGFAHCHSCHV